MWTTFLRHAKNGGRNSQFMGEILYTYRLTVIFYKDYLNANSVFTWTTLPAKRDKWSLKGKSFHAAKKETENLIPKIVKQAPEGFTRCCFIMSGQDHLKEWHKAWDWSINKKGEITEEGEDKIRIRYKNSR